MIDSLIRDLRILWRADALIGKVWAGFVVRRIGLLAFGGVIAALGLAMANVAGLFALQTVVSSAWAAAIVACVDFVLAILVVVLARQPAPARELELAYEVRNIAAASIQTDARDLKLTLDGLGQEARSATETLIRFAKDPLDTATEKLLVPAALSLIRSLRSRHKAD